MFKLDHFPETRPRFTDQLSFVAEPGTRAALQRAAEITKRSVPDLLREAAGVIVARAQPAPATSLATIADEDFGAAVEDLSALWNDHWSSEPLIPAGLDLDWPKLSAMAERGFVLLTVARLDNVLVGALASLIDSHLHYRTTLCSQVVLDLVRPGFRSSDLSSRLLAAHDLILKARGVVKASIVTPLDDAGAHNLISAGWRAAETLYAKDLI